MDGLLFQAIIEFNGEHLILDEVIAKDDDQAFEMINGRLKHYGKLKERELWLNSGGIIAGVKSEFFKRKPRQGGQGPDGV